MADQRCHFRPLISLVTGLLVISFESQAIPDLFDKDEISTKLETYVRTLIAQTNIFYAIVTLTSM